MTISLIDSTEQTRTMHACTICNNKFATKQYCVRHVLEFHINVQSLYCKKCSTTFETMGELKEHLDLHMEKCHISIGSLKAIKCPLCTQILSNKCYYKQHMREHSRTMPAKELACDLRGRHEKNNLRGQSKNHQAIELETTKVVKRQRYQCYRCKLYVLTMPRLWAHMAIHTKNEL